MSMLAEPRSRQKWSADPRNTNWSQDKTKFGYQMLTKMGWSEGNGLGQNLTGNVDHVKVKKRGNNLGIGVKKSHDDDWIAHQDDFNALLASLNGKESDTSTADKIESKTNSSKFRYTKFVKSKDLSSASSKDLACIFGQRGKSSPEPTPPCKEEEEPKLDDEKKEDAEVVNEELSVKTVESSLSMSEYFAQKMAALKQKTNNGNCYQSVPINGNNDDDIVKEVVSNATVESVTPTESEGKKKKKKKKKLVEVTDENVLECQRIEEEDENENCISGKKRKKESEVVLEEGVVKKKKKKKREEERDQEFEVVQQVETVVEVTKKKKKKKKKEREQASE